MPAEKSSRRTPAPSWLALFIGVALLLPLDIVVSVNAAPAAEAEVGVLLEEGFRHLDEGRPQQAQERFSRALAVDPNSISAHEGLMWAYLEIGDLTKSLQFADAMRALAPNDLRILRHWITVSANDPERRKEVLAATARISKEAPDEANNGSFISAMMWFHHDLEDTTNALYYADRLRAQAPDDLQVLREWTEVVVANDPERRKEVLAAAARISKEAPDEANNGSFISAMMWFHHDLEDTTNALYYADRLRAQAPDDLQVLREWMEVAALIPSKQEDLLLASERLLRNNQDDVDTLEFVADILLRSAADHRRTVEIYEHLLYLDSNHPKALLEIARNAKFNGDLITALELLERAQAAHPGNDEIRIAVVEIHDDAERLRSAKIGPTLPIVLAITVLPLLFGTFVRRVTSRIYMAIAVHAVLVSVASLCWLYLFPLD